VEQKRAVGMAQGIKHLTSKLKALSSNPRYHLPSPHSEKDPITWVTRKNKHRLRVKVWKKISQANGAPKQAGIGTLISDKAELKPRRDKEGHLILTKGTIQQEDITIVCAPNFIKQTLLEIKTQIDPNILTVGDFNTRLSPSQNIQIKNKDGNFRIK
jgi:hypothetical protein